MHVFFLLFLLILPFCVCRHRGRCGWGAFWLTAIVAFALLQSDSHGVGALGAILLVFSPVIGMLCWSLADPEPTPGERAP